jgi:hypothetical protein
MKRIILSAALLMGAVTLTFAINPTSETKDSKSETKNTEVVVKWFHFTGDASVPSQLQDPANYDEETSPTCSSTSATYRCDIQIQTLEGDDTQPDLSQPILDSRKRATAN